MKPFIVAVGIMLHLAKVVKQKPVGGAELQLLAYQKPDSTWEICPKEEMLIIETNSKAFHDASSNGLSLAEGTLVLIEIIDDCIETLQDATNWILNLIRDYLQVSVTPTFLVKEMEQAEQWRQALTLESQELARRSLEVEARLENIQTLEENLRKEKQRLEELAIHLQMDS